MFFNILMYKSWFKFVFNINHFIKNQVKNIKKFDVNDLTNTKKSNIKVSVKGSGNF